MFTLVTILVCPGPTILIGTTVLVVDDVATIIDDKLVPVEPNLIEVPSALNVTLELTLSPVIVRASTETVELITVPV